MFGAIDKWLPSYLNGRLARLLSPIPQPLHVVFCIADHFVPFPDDPEDRVSAIAAADRWATEYASLAHTFSGCDGVPPRHTFFYASDQYDDAVVDRLQSLCAQRLAEVEVLVSHGRTTAEQTRPALAAFRDRLRNDHGLLGTQADAPAYAAAHRHGAICSSGRWRRGCGVDHELTVLRETGCYVDMSMPTAVRRSQARTVNAIYYAPRRRRRAHDRGRHVRSLPATETPVVQPGHGELMLVPGPLALDWRWRRWRLLPRLEYGDITPAALPYSHRAALWVRPRIHVLGRSNWVFVKVRCDGADAAAGRLLLGAAMRGLHNHLGAAFNDGKQHRLYYATAREMYNMIKAAEAGARGAPGDYRDFAVTPPPIATGTLW
jgi:hypothetical protein